MPNGRLVGRSGGGTASALLNVASTVSLSDVSGPPGLELEECIHSVNDHRDEAEEGISGPGFVLAAPGSAGGGGRQEEEAPQSAIGQFLSVEQIQLAMNG